MPVTIVSTDFKNQMELTVVAMNGITRQTYESAIETMILRVAPSSCVGSPHTVVKESG